MYWREKCQLKNRNAAQRYYLPNHLSQLSVFVRDRRHTKKETTTAPTSKQWQWNRLFYQRCVSFTTSEVYACIYAVVLQPKTISRELIELTYYTGTGMLQQNVFVSAIQWPDAPIFVLKIMRNILKYYFPLNFGWKTKKFHARIFEVDMCIYYLIYYHKLWFIMNICCFRLVRKENSVKIFGFSKLKIMD